MVLAKRISEKQIKEIIDAFINKKSLEEISKKFNFTKLTISRHLKKNLGEDKFTKINKLKPGENFINKNLNIKATSGASVPNIEYGYIIELGLDSIYIEPHGFLDKKIKPRNVDLLITPVIDFSLPLAGKFIKGKTVLPQLLKLFNPKTVLVSTTGGDIIFTGVINNLIKVDGSVEDISLFKDKNTNLINPEVLKIYEFDKTK